MSRFSLYLFRPPELRDHELEQLIGQLPDEVNRAAVLRMVRTREYRMTLIAEGDLRARMEALHHQLMNDGFEVMLVDESQALDDWSDKASALLRRWFPVKSRGDSPSALEWSPLDNKAKLDSFIRAQQEEGSRGASLFGFLLPDLKKLIFFFLVVGLAMTPILLLARYAEKHSAELLAQAAKPEPKTVVEQRPPSDSEQVGDDGDRRALSQEVAARSQRSSLESAADPLSGSAAFALGTMITLFLNLFALRRRMVDGHDVVGGSQKRMAIAALMALGAFVTLVAGATVVFRILNPPMQLPRGGLAMQSRGMDLSGRTGGALSAPETSRENQSASNEDPVPPAPDGKGRFATLLEQMGGQPSADHKKPFASLLQQLNGKKPPSADESTGEQGGAPNELAANVQSARQGGRAGSTPGATLAKSRASAERSSHRDDSPQTADRLRLPAGSGAKEALKDGEQRASLERPEDSVEPEPAVKAGPVLSSYSSAFALNDLDAPGSRMELDCVRRSRGRPASVSHEADPGGLADEERYPAARRTRVFHAALDVREPAYDFAEAAEPVPVPSVRKVEEPPAVVLEPVPVPVSTASLGFTFVVGLLSSFAVSLGLRRVWGRTA